MAPVKRKTSKKATTTANLAALKNVSNDPFLNNQQEEQEEELSINKSNNSFNSKNSSPKKLASSKSKASNNKEAKSNNGMNLEEMKVMLEDFDLEAAAQIRSLTSKMEEKLEQTKRHWKSTIDNLDSKTSSILYKDFLNLYNGDFKLALQSITTNSLVPKLQISNLEQSVRKRKRVLDTPVLQQQGDDSDDVFGIPLSANNTLAKKARSHNNISTNPPSSISRNAVASTSKPSTVNRAGPSGRNLKGMTGGGTPSSRNQLPPQSRFNRLSIDPSTNFVYRVDGPLSLSQSAPLTAPPTPHLGGTSGVGASAIKRKPRRGESIIMLSVNDSPLGYLMADEVDDNNNPSQQGATEDEEEEEEEEEGEEEGEEWDLMERHEASRVEEQGRSKKLTTGAAKGKGKGKGKAKLVKKSTSQNDLTSSAIRRSTRAASSSSTTTNTIQQKPFDPPQQSFTFGTSSKQSQSQSQSVSQVGGGQDDFLRKMEIYLGEMNLGMEAKNELREKMKGMF